MRKGQTLREYWDVTTRPATLPAYAFTGTSLTSAPLSGTFSVMAHKGSDNHWNENVR